MENVMAYLKPCPFCGSEGSVHVDDRSYSYFRDYTIYCENCDCIFTLDNVGATHNDVVEAWNRRGERKMKQKQDKNTEYDGKWVPCSERLPGKEGTYLTTTTSGKVRINHYYSHHKVFGYQNNAVAWMPLPKPYKEELYGRD